MDRNVAKNALDFIGEVYKDLQKDEKGENLWQCIGKLNDKQKTDIQNRIKMINKGNDKMNTSISTSTPMRKSFAPPATASNKKNPMNSSLNQTLNRSIN